MIAEGGLKIMNELLEDRENGQSGIIHNLAQTVINQCLIYMKNTVEESSQ